MSLSIDPSKIRNSKELTNALQSAGLKINGAKELLYDEDDEIVGVVTRTNKPIIFDDKQHKMLMEYLR